MGTSRALAQTLIEEPFQLEGFLYTYADIVKEENRVSERQTHTETVTVETWGGREWAYAGSPLLLLYDGRNTAPQYPAL